MPRARLSIRFWFDEVVGASLCVPNASIMKAGIFMALTRKFGVRAVDRVSHLFLGQQKVNGFPGRQFRIMGLTTMNKRELRNRLAGITKANIAVRNFPLSADALRKRLKLKDGGSCYLFATTMQGRHVIFIDLGVPEALEEARSLFVSTMADLVVMSLDEHDRLIAFVLGLSHALNIAFFTALAESGEAAPRLARMSSTTFDAQLDVATRVAAESPELYYEIQSLNQYGDDSLQALSTAVERLHRAVREHDPQAFTEMMRRGHEYLQVRKAAREPAG